MWLGNTALKNWEGDLKVWDAKIFFPEESEEGDEGVTFNEWVGCVESVGRVGLGAYDGTCKIRNCMVDIQSFLYKNYEVSRSQINKRASLLMNWLEISC